MELGDDGMVRNYEVTMYKKPCDGCGCYVRQWDGVVIGAIGSTDFDELLCCPCADEKGIDSLEDGYCCEVCGEFVPMGEECGDPDLDQWMCPDCYTSG